jgi:cytochrome c
MHKPVFRASRPIRRVVCASLSAAWLAACSASLTASKQATLDEPLRRSADAIGAPVSEADIAAWNIDVAPDGRGLPAGSGDVAMGGKVFAAKCAACHGAKGEGQIGDPLVGGRGTLASASPKRTVGSYWPYATTLFDYIRRAMPYNAPQSLTADEVYAVSAWILNQNGIVPDDARLDAHSLAAVRMPNRDGFVSDPRPGRL